jgi:DNA-binding response OmpR family regulator
MDLSIVRKENNMSQQHPLILYVGDRAKGRTLLDTALENGGWAYLAEDAAEALGAYVAYTPDAVVLDPQAVPEMAAEVYHHLRSIEAHPIFILTPDRAWDRSVTEADEVYVLRPDITANELLTYIQTALEPIELHPAFLY